MAYRCRSKDKILYGDRTCGNCEGYPIDPEKPVCYMVERDGLRDWIYNCSEAVWQEGILKNRKVLHTTPFFTISPHIPGAKVEIVYIWGENGKLWFAELRSPDKYFKVRSESWTLSDLGLKKTMTIEEMREVAKRHKVNPNP